MPRVCEFYGIVVYVYYDDHPDAHFHAVYGGDEVAIRISDMSVMAGRLPPRAMGLVVEWASARKAALAEDWQLASEHLPLKPIAPMK